MVWMIGMGLSIVLAFVVVDPIIMIIDVGFYVFLMIALLEKNNEKEKASVLEAAKEFQNSSSHSDGGQKYSASSIQDQNHKQNVEGDIVSPTAFTEVNFELAKDECILSTAKCTYGIYPSLRGILYLTNQRIVVKVAPFWKTALFQVIGKLTPISISTSFTETKADIPLSAIRMIMKSKFDCSIREGNKTHFIFKIPFMFREFDDTIDQIAALVKQECGRDVLKS